MAVVRRTSQLSAILGVACAVLLASAPAVAAPLVTGDLTIYYDFDSFTDTVMDGSGNGFNGKVQDGTRNVLDGDTGREDLVTTGVISNDTSNPRRGAGAIRFTQTDQTWMDPNAPDPNAVVIQDPVFVDMDGGHIKANHHDKLPLEKATYAAWVNIEPINAGFGWNSPASIVQGSTAGPGHGAPHFHAEGNGSIRLTMRDEFGSNVVSADIGGHPFPNQPDIDGSGAAPMPWPTNTWFHLAATYDMAANDWALYYNGVEIRGGAPVGLGPLGEWDQRAFDARPNFYDGLGIGAVYDSGGRRLHGMMDELYIFNRALSAAEIQTLYNIPAAGVPGDYNNNGTVDAADYVVWRNGDSPDDTSAGYDLWKANFGKTAAAGSGAVVGAVPEPASIGLLLVCLGILAGGRRHR